MSDSKGKMVRAIYKNGYKPTVYASWDKGTTTWVMRYVYDKHICTRNMVENGQLKYSWIAKHYIMRFK